MNIRIILSVAVLAAAPLAGQETTAVPLTLQEAVTAALDGNRGLAAAEARADAAALGARAGEGFLFPNVQATAGAMRTNDPVGVFGTKLRQRRFAAEDFDVGALNDPDAVTDWTAGIGAQWDIAQLHRWVERDAGDARSRAAEAMLDRTREGTVFRTRARYVEAVRADAGLRALEAALASATATRDRVRRRVEEGMGTQADVLQAEAAVSGLQARVEHARAQVADARESLGSWLGWPRDRTPVPSQGADVLNAAAPAELTGNALMDRADLVAGRAGVEAAEADARAVSARRLPGVQAFGMLSTHAPGIADGRESNWTVGVQLSVPVFTGFSLTRGAEAARAQARALALEQAQREEEAWTEVRSARRGVEAARGALRAATAARDAADEAVRLLRRRYEEGMATVADLLQAEAQAAALNTGVVDAEANLSMALAALDFVLGREAAGNGAGLETP
ncbi:MAG TPA: TolC family protein [Longimicrobiales bacterium]|nr:TolC family protein [Longimicrobiales bacterium]